jgi:iron complex transport system permease protein
MARVAAHPWLGIFLLVLFAAAVLLVAPWVGMEWVSPGDVLGGSASPVERKIFWQLRVPRVLVAVLAGGGLALCGMTFQALFRNALATPFTLGVSSGAALGAALFVWLGVGAGWLVVSGMTVAAFIGAVGSMALVYGLTRLKGGFSTATLLLAGVAVNFTFASLILFVQYISNLHDAFRILRWMMGGLEVTGYDQVLIVAPFVVLGTGVLLFLVHDLNLLTTGEDLALSRGVAVGRTRVVLFVVCSLIVGSVVAVCGPIGFVGLMAPHICRLLIGPDHRVLAPASLLFGGAFLVLCDAAARTVIAPAEMPVGILTAMLGGPFFVWLLVSRTHGRTIV